MEKKVHNEELRSKNLKLDIANLQENCDSLKRNYEMIIEKYEFLKNEKNKFQYETEDKNIGQINQLNLSIRKVKY